MIEKHLKWARFPYQKSLDMFEMDGQPSLSNRQMNQLKELSWMEQSYNLIFLGPPGVGKTHLAIGLGLKQFIKGTVSSLFLWES
ncbi:ATP-binding protein [Alteribacillus sp. JSM 102045]|uniref:ATP-binding protein n=1 Tax=Alteribacillus sp. JSM 102045 TaxID=1562101 RepID=UPI0035BEE775